MVIGIVNQKGGTGKTTLAINLADGFVRSAQRVLLADVDPQESVISWHYVKKTRTSASSRFATYGRPIASPGIQ